MFTQVLAGATVLFAGAALANPIGSGSFVLGGQIDLSTAPVGGFDGQASSEGQIARVEFRAGGDFAAGWRTVLVAIYRDAQGPEVWTVEGKTLAARDIFATNSMDGGLTWSQPVNVSKTAQRFSKVFAADPDSALAAYYGDSLSPSIVSFGPNVMVTWADRYVPTGVQGSSQWLEEGRIPIPHAGMYAVRSTDGGFTWSAPELLTDGTRDAVLQQAAACEGGFLLSWQEDPLGLMPDDFGGPFPQVAEGSDIWYTALSAAGFRSNAAFPAPKRLTSNYLYIDAEAARPGRHGASNVTAALAGGIAIIGYEETKDLAGVEGKQVVYHTFSAFDNSMLDPTKGEGWVISLPDENARDLRLVMQSEDRCDGTPVQLMWLYTAGDDFRGGSGDIIARIGRIDWSEPGSTGLRPQDLRPMLNQPGLNLSSSMGLGARPYDDPFEDARTPVGLIAGDKIAAGWLWTSDLAAGRYSDQDNYNVFMRRSLDGGMTWTAIDNMSQIDRAERVNARDLRISGSARSQNPATPPHYDTFVVAWGTEVNQFEHLALEPLYLDVQFTRTANFGETFAPVRSLTSGVSPDAAGAGDRAAFGPELALNAAGDRLHAVWQARDTASGATNTLYRGGRATCAADFDASGVLDFFDFLAFQAAFTGGDRAADFDGDGELTFFDFLAFQSAFAAGCNSSF